MPVLREDERDGKNRRQFAVVAWLGVLGAVVVMVGALYFTPRRTEPDTLLAAPPMLAFSGPAFQKKPPDPIVVRLRNLIVLCSRSDLIAAAAYIDPESTLAGRPEAVCGALTGMFPHGVPTDYRFEHYAAVDDEASVYISIHAGQHAGERYIFNMRRVKGKWYFTVP